MLTYCVVLAYILTYMTKSHSDQSVSTISLPHGKSNVTVKTKRSARADPWKAFQPGRPRGGGVSGDFASSQVDKAVNRRCIPHQGAFALAVERY